MTGQFIIVRSDALEDPELIKSPTLFMTLCAISTMTSQNKGGWCFFKQETIAKRLGKSRQAISKSLNKLKELGYLEITAQSYKGRQSNNLYRLTYDNPLAAVQCDVAPMPQADVAPPAQCDVAPKRTEYIKEKEKKALTREEFLREIDGAYQGGAFSEWDHLTETEIKIAAQSCLDFYGSKGEWPAGKPVYVLRHWIRGGIQKGSIRKAAPSKEARQGASEEKTETKLQPWQAQLAQQMDEGKFKAWIKPLYWNGNGKVLAPSPAVAAFVAKNYADQIAQVLPNVEIVHEVSENA